MMAAKWLTVTFGEVVSLTQGLCFNAKTNHLMAESGIPLLRIADLINNTQTKFVDAERVPRKFIAVPEDIIYTRTGQVGLVFRGKIGVVHNNCFRVIPKDGIERDYLYWYLRLPSVIEKARSLAGGAAQPDLGHDAFKSISFTYPDLAEQRRIAGILSTYDELIDNSQRRIRILEEMARALYREWFVYFRFPGHENHPRITSPLGEIPKGWEVKTIADVCESVSYGYTASASREAVGPKFLRITDIVPDLIDWAGVPFCEIPESKAPKYLLEPGDIVVARTGATTGYAKRLNKRHPPTVFASYLVRVRACAGVSNRMLGVLMESDDYKQFVKTNIGGAAQPQANAIVLTSMRIVEPPAALGAKFDSLVEPLLDEAELLAVKIQNLRRTRDLLLPRLLSGEVELETVAA
jgi:type I restriction enzyme S subunit